MYSLRNNFISPVGIMTPKIRRNWQITSLNVILQRVFSRCSQSVDFLKRSELNLSRFHSPLLSVTVGLLYSRWTPGRIVFVFSVLHCLYPPIFLRSRSTVPIDKHFTQSESHMETIKPITVLGSHKPSPLFEGFVCSSRVTKVGSEIFTVC